MPFNFSNFQHYSIDYTNLFNTLNSYNIFDNKELQTQYLKNWMHVLKEHDKILTEQLASKEDINKLILNLQSEPEIFQLPLHHESNTIFIHFRASIANLIIKHNKLESMAQHIDIHEFTKKDSKICWNPVNENVDRYVNSKGPIIMVPFYNGHHENLVIDGNHRITYKTKNNVNDIKALILAEQTTIGNSIFSSSFDKFYYIMHNEISHMVNEYHDKKTNVFELVRKSYLNEGKFKFITR
ncbi:MAG: hypothetical protein ACRCVJ_13245 [Clostridium sp.]|uniref:hypothetical protein n=1 Tax=Clostridium sp. TaxID=1506 RepID=UPI003F39EAA6